jgi:hypothetical protein
LLNARAASSQGDDDIADRVLARRIRREVLTLCEAAMASGMLKGDETFWVAAAGAMDDQLHERPAGEAGSPQPLRIGLP